MKINIKKIVKLGTSFCAVLSLVLFSFAPRSFAADINPPDVEPIVVTVNAMDHIEDIVIDGDVKTVYFRFLGLKYRVNAWMQPSGSKYFVFGKETGSPYFLTLPDGTTSFTSRVYLFGSEAFENQPAPVGVLDVSDIMPGASLELTIGYNLSFAATLSGTVKYSQGAFLYDADGGYLDLVYVSENTTYVSVDGAFNQKFDVPGTLILPHNVSYVLPFTSISFSSDDGYDLGGLTLTFVPYTLEMSVDINMIYENSQTMDAIKDQLGDISQGIQDSNDKLEDVSQGIQDTNDKLDDTKDKLDDANQTLDDILTGGEYADESKEHSDKLTGSSSLLSDAVSSMVNASNNLPTSPDLGDIMDDDTAVVLDDAIDDASLIFDWERSGLFNMFVPMGLSVSLAVLFYSIFGKRG